MKQLGYRTHPQLKGPGSWRALSENRREDGPGTKCKAKSKRKTKTNSHATTFHMPPGVIPGQSDGPRVPVTVIPVGRRNSLVGVYMRRTWCTQDGGAPCISSSSSSTSWDFGVGRRVQRAECASWGPAQLAHLGEVCGHRWPLSRQVEVGQECSRVG